MMRILPVAAGILAALVQSAALALGLGEMTVHSRLGERLDATIPLRADGGPSSIKLALAGGEDYRRAGVEPTLLALNFSVSRDSAGDLQARITSRDLLRDPALVMILEARDAHSRVLRQYRPFDPATEASAQASATAAQNLDEYLAASRADTTPAPAPGAARRPPADHPPLAAGTLVFLPPAVAVPVPTPASETDSETRVPLAPPAAQPTPVRITSAASLPPVAEQPVAKPAVAIREPRPQPSRATSATTALAPMSVNPLTVASAQTPTINPQTVQPGWTPDGILSPLQVAQAQSAAIKAAPASSPPAPLAPSAILAPAGSPKVIANPPHVRASGGTQPVAVHASGGVRVTKAGRVYGPVARDETLWRVATKLRPDSGVSMDQMLLGLYRHNPQAFVGGIQKLGKGAMLKVPTREAFLAVEAADATRQLDALLKRKPKATVVAKPSRTPPATVSPTLASAMAPDSVPPSAEAAETAETQQAGNEQVEQERVAAVEPGQSPTQEVALADVPADDAVEVEAAAAPDSEEPGMVDEALPAAGMANEAPVAVIDPNGNAPAEEGGDSAAAPEAEVDVGAGAGDGTPASSAALDQAADWIRSLQDGAAEESPGVRLDPALIERLVQWKLQIAGGLIALLLAALFLTKARRRQKQRSRHMNSFRDQRPTVVRSSVSHPPVASPWSAPAPLLQAVEPLRPAAAPPAVIPTVIGSAPGVAGQADDANLPQRPAASAADAARGVQATQPARPAQQADDGLRFALDELDELDELSADETPIAVPSAAVDADERSTASEIKDDDVIPFALQDENPLASYSLPVEPAGHEPLSVESTAFESAPPQVQEPAQAQNEVEDDADDWIAAEGFAPAASHEPKGTTLSDDRASRAGDVLAWNPDFDNAVAESSRTEPAALNLDDIDLALDDLEPDGSFGLSLPQPGLDSGNVPASPVAGTAESAEAVTAEDEDAAIKLDLAQAYVEMGDRELARALLDEILEQGGAAQREKARALLAQLSA